MWHIAAFCRSVGSDRHGRNLPLATMDAGAAADEGSGISDGKIGATGPLFAILVLAIPAQNKHIALSVVGEGNPASLLIASMVHARSFVCDCPVFLSLDSLRKRRNMLGSAGRNGVWCAAANLCQWTRIPVYRFQVPAPRPAVIVDKRFGGRSCPIAARTPPGAVKISRSICVAAGLNCL